MDPNLKEQLILREYLTKQNPDVAKLNDEQFGRLYSSYKSKQKGIVGDLVDRAKAGFENTTAAGRLIAGDYEGATEDIKRANELRMQDPELDQRISELVDDDSAVNTLINLVTDPKATAGVLAESLATSIPAALTALPVGRAAQAIVKGGPAVARVAGSTVFGGITGGVEYGATVLQTLAESGVDITNPEQIEMVITDPDIGPRIKEEGLRRGVPIAAFDAVSFGIAGRLAKAIPNKTLGLAAESAAQAVAGGGGEAAAQLAQKGEITSPGEIALEAGLETVTAVPQAIIQPGLEAVLQGKKQGTSDAPKDEIDPTITVEEEPDIQTTPETSQTTPEKDTDLEKRVKQGEKLIQPPKEVVRGTPKQMKSRLLSLKKEDLVDRAEKYLNLSREETQKQTKSVLADRILKEYGIDQTKQDAVQTAKPKVRTTQTPKTQTFKLTPEQQGINEVSRKELLKIAETPVKNDPSVSIADLIRQKEIQSNARNWLVNLPDNQTLSSYIGKTAKGLYTPDGVALEKANQAIKTIKSSNVRDTTRVKATTQLVKTLQDANYFSNTEQRVMGPQSKELVDYAIDKLGADASSRPLVEKMLQNPKTKEKIIGQLFEDFREGRPVNIKSPEFKSMGNRFRRLLDNVEVPEHRQTKEPTIVPPEQEIAENIRENSRQSEFETFNAVRLMRDNAETPSALWKLESYGLEKDAYKKSGIGSTYKSFLRSMDFMKTMVTKARDEPIFAPFFQLYRAKDAFREQLMRQQINDMTLIVQRNGIKRVGKAVEILNIMAGPHNKSGPQVIQTNEAGQVRFKDKDGKMKVLDLGTSQTLKDLQSLMKQEILLEVQTFKQRASETYGLKPDFTREELLDKIDELYALGQDASAQKLQSLSDVFDTQDKLYRSNKAYIPHTRNRGPFAIATYVKDEDGNLELAGLYSIKADKNGSIDRKDEQEVRQRIERDQQEDKVIFYNGDGESVTTAQPFLMTYNDLRKAAMKDAKNPALPYEAISHLLTNKNIDPNVLNQAFDEMSFDSDTERFFVNYREKKNYYGYDNDDPLSSILDSLAARAAMLTRFKYQAPLTKLKAEADLQLQKLGPQGTKSLKELNKYYNYMGNPADDAAKIRELTFWYFLAGNPSTSLLQLMSTYMNTLPWLAQYQNPIDFVKSNVKSVSSSLVLANKIQQNKALLTNRTLKEFSRKVGLNEAKSKVLLRLYERGVLDPGYAIDAVNYSRNKEKQRKLLRGEQQGVAFNVVEGTRNVLQGMIQVTEDVARLNTALLVLDSIDNSKSFEKIGKLLYSNDALFRSLVKSKYDGKITKDAILEHAVDENHAVFGKIARPDALRSRLGAGLFAFLQYPISILEQYMRLLTQRGIEGKKAALNILLTYPILFGGMTAIPGYETWDWLTKWIQRLNGGQGPTNLDIVLTDMLEDTGIQNAGMKDLIMKGAILSGGAGVDASQRISIQYPFQPFLDVLLSPESADMTSRSQALQFLGPLATIPVGALNVLNQVEKGSSIGEATVDSLAPIWVRNIKKAGDIAAGDLRTQTGKRVLPSPEENPELFSNKGGLLETLTGVDMGPADEIIKQGLGLRPALVSEASRAHYAQRVLQEAEKDGRSRYYAKIAKAITNYNSDKNSKTKQELVQSIVDLTKYNNTLDNPKTRKELIRGLKQSLRGRLEAEESPLKQRQTISKSSKLSDVADRVGLPRIKDFVEDKE